MTLGFSRHCLLGVNGIGGLSKPQRMTFILIAEKKNYSLFRLIDSSSLV